MGEVKVSTTGRGYRDAVDQLGDAAVMSLFAAAFAALGVEANGLSRHELNGRLQVNEKGLTLTIYVGAEVDEEPQATPAPAANDRELAWSAKQDETRESADAELRERVGRIQKEKA